MNPAEDARRMATGWKFLRPRRHRNGWEEEGYRSLQDDGAEIVEQFQSCYFRFCAKFESNLEESTPFVGRFPRLRGRGALSERQYLIHLIWLKIHADRIKQITSARHQSAPF
jgi:hypothetical protein